MIRNVASAAGLLAAALFFVIASPAAAAVTTATLTATTPSSSGKCPVTEAFSGAISGTPGTMFQYSFNRFINGVQQIQNVGAGTIPSGGSLAVSDSFSIGSSSTGANFDQIWVHNIAGGQADLYSTKATFAVTCVNPYSVLHPGTNTLIRPVITLHTKWWGWRKYEYKWVGISTFVPEVGTGPCADLCLGWVHIKNGDSLWLYHWNFYLRSVVLFDQGSITGAKPTKAALTLKMTSGNMSCLGGLGRATVNWQGGANDFNAPYPNDGDFSAPVSMQTGPGTATFDVTSIVQGWASGASTNNGFVLRGNTEDNGSNGNDSCTLDFGTDGVLTITQ